MTAVVVDVRRPLRSTLVALAVTVALVTSAAGTVGGIEKGRAWLHNDAPVADPLVADDKVDPGLLTGPLARPEVIVQAAPGQTDAAAAAVEAAGGDVGRQLAMIDGFAARLDTARLLEAAESPAIRAITANRAVSFEELSYDSTTTASNFARTSGATTAWAQNNLGAGVGVAVLDTGISAMNDFAGRIVNGPDLSGEGTTIDTYGHGTVMGGIIAGSGADSANRTAGAYTGVAPRAHLVAVKAAGRNGASDVTTLLQGMHWVAAYKDQFNIRVLNLSWGTRSTQDPSLDPLNYAVQRLWGLGIVVVVAAGNNGPNSGTILKPADDPMVISVGSYDDKQNADPADDAMSSWSSRGPTPTGLVKPDVVAPGRTLVAARSYGSAVETDNPRALVAPSYIKGSGTSEAAAVVSGLAALLIAARPELTPDQVKAVLKNTASPIVGPAPNTQGNGRVQLGNALTASPGAAAWQTATASGLGSIEASRAGMNVETDCNNDGTVDVIKGEIDVRCEAWNGSAWTGSAWTGSAWTGSAWTGSAWTGSAWTGSAWTGSAWTGSAWTGGTWTGSAWTGSAWTGSAWTGSAWTGSAWTGSAWTGSAWTGSAWTGSAWTSAEYEEDIFLTAWWGNSPYVSQRIPGEPAQPDPPGRPGPR